MLKSVHEADLEASRIKDEVFWVLRGVCNRVEREQLQMDARIDDEVFMVLRGVCYQVELEQLRMDALVAYTNYRTMLVHGNQ